MNKKNDMQKLGNKLEKMLKKEIPLSVGRFTAYIIFAVLFSSIVYYTIGLNEGYQKKVSEIQKEKAIMAEQALMDKPYAEVKDTFLKFLMVKTMSNIGVISIALLFILFLRAIF